LRRPLTATLRIIYGEAAAFTKRLGRRVRDDECGAES
jgi:hypothetical protein